MAVARLDGSVDYLVMTKEASALMTRFFATIDTILMGRKTLDAVVAMTGSSYKSPGRIPSYVFSRTQPPGERDGVILTNESPRHGCPKCRVRFEDGPASTSSTWAVANSRAAYSRPTSSTSCSWASSHLAWQRSSPFPRRLPTTRLHFGGE